MAEINTRFVHHFHCSLHYHLLRQLDLGRDAASLWSPDISLAPWAQPLKDIYMEAGAMERIAMQILPLQVRDVDELINGLRLLSTPLSETLADILLVEEPDFVESWSMEKEVALARRAEVTRAIGGPLQRLREALWARRGVTTPPLQEVVDVAALGRHGRAVDLGGWRRCAVSLAMPCEHVLCQIFHEETHSIADPETYERWQQRGGMVRASERDTRASGDGYRLHREIEEHAIQVGAEVMAKALPGWMGAYEAWCATFR